MRHGQGIVLGLVIVVPLWMALCLTAWYLLAVMP